MEQLNSMAAITVRVEGISFQYRLTEDDLSKVFGRYGELQSVEVGEDGSAARVWFKETKDADAAIRELHGKLLNGEEGSLVVTWATQDLSNICPYSILFYLDPFATFLEK